MPNVGNIQREFNVDGIDNEASVHIIPISKEIEYADHFNYGTPLKGFIDVEYKDAKLKRSAASR